MGSQKKYYAVIRGGRPGIYPAWFGTGGAEEQVRGYAGAVYKGFATLEEARRWVEHPVTGTRKAAVLPQVGTEPAPPAARPGQVTIYTDGGCLGNPGAGGYGAVILAGENRCELSQGFRRTTNNRMELMACIAALAFLKDPAEIVLHSDSRYVVDGIGKGWARKWRRNGWMRTKGEPAENSDLWAKLLDQCDRHRVRFVWVHGHAGNAENERCDRLATAAAQRNELREDDAYVRGCTRMPEGCAGEDEFSGPPGRRRSP